jgi:hypothetical protein
MAQKTREKMRGIQPRTTVIKDRGLLTKLDSNLYEMPYSQEFAWRCAGVRIWPLLRALNKK